MQIPYDPILKEALKYYNLTWHLTQDQEVKIYIVEIHHSGHVPELWFVFFYISSIESFFKEFSRVILNSYMCPPDECKRCYLAG